MGSIEPPIANEREELESSFAKLEWLVVLVNITDTTDKEGLVESKSLRAFITTGPEAKASGRKAS